MSAACPQVGPPEHSSADAGRQCPLCQIVLPLRQRAGELLGVPYSDDALDALEEEELRRALNLLRRKENVAVKKKQHMQSSFAA